jgi:hypothetical protein
VAVDALDPFSLTRRLGTKEQLVGAVFDHPTGAIT